MMVYAESIFKGSILKMSEIGDKVKRFVLHNPIAQNAIGGLIVVAVMAFLGFVTGVFSDLYEIIKLKESFVTTSDLSGLAKSTDLEGLLTAKDLEGLLTAKDLEGLLTAEDLRKVERELDGIQGEIGNINNAIDDINRSLGRVEGIVSVAVKPEEDFARKISDNYKSDDKVYTLAGSNLFEDTKQVIATDIKSGDVYTVEDLEGAPFLLSYIDQSGDEVFFYGQYDEYGRWAGRCITNRYQDEKLCFIMDAEYHSGKLVSYKQAFTYTNGSGTNVWAVSEREVEDGNSIGVTRTYIKKGDYIKNFDIKTLKPENILNADDFPIVKDLVIEGYYNGYTSNGSFNDDTGEAYMVKYNEDGTVRMLYVGDFIEGLPDDDSGNAWSISFGYDKSNYYYYKGVFYGGKRKGKQRRISQEEINKIVEENNFDVELTWFQKSNNSDNDYL